MSSSIYNSEIAFYYLSLYPYIYATCSARASSARYTDEIHEKSRRRTETYILHRHSVNSVVTLRKLWMSSSHLHRVHMCIQETVKGTIGLEHCERLKDIKYIWRLPRCCSPRFRLFRER